MTSEHSSQRIGGEPEPPDTTGTDHEEPSKLKRLFRRGLTSGAFAGLGGGVVLWSGLRALRRGKHGRGIGGLLAGTILITVGARQRQASGELGSPHEGVEQRDVVDTSPDVGGAGMEEAGPASSGRERAGGETAQAATESSIDIEDVSDGFDEERDDVDEHQVDFETGVDDSVEELGEERFDDHRGVPVPEPAFEEGFLEIATDAFWAIREDDDAVFVSDHRAVFEDADGVEYVTSSAVDDEQLLAVPEAVLDHWEGIGDEESVGDSAVLVFVTTDDLRQEAVLWLVPEYQAEEWFEE